MDVKEKGADELFKEFKEVSITEFFRKNKAHLGYSGKLRSLTTVVHEIVTNALDAVEEANILPEIEIEIKEIGKEHYKFFASDNGPGIPIKHLPSVFGKMLAGTKFHRNVQLRGQQGIGVSTTHDALICLDDGRFKPIGTLVEKNYTEKILSFNDSSNEVIKGQVIKQIKNPEREKFIKVKTWGGLELVLTPEHMLLAKESKHSKAIHIPVKKLEGGMFLPLGLSEHDTINPHENLVPIFNLIDTTKYRIYDRPLVLEVMEKLRERHGSYGGVYQHYNLPKERLRGWYRDRRWVANPNIDTLKKFSSDLGYELPHKSSIEIGNYHHKLKLPFFVDEDLCWLMGFLASEGHIHKGKNKWGTGISVTNQNKVLLEKTREILKKLELKSREYEHKGTMICFGSVILTEIAEKFGIPALKKSHRIKVSDLVLQLPNRLLKMYLRGLFDGDGSICIGKRNLSINLSTQSKKLAKQVQLILLSRFGIFSSFKVNKSKGKRPCYSVVVYSRKFMSKFLDKIGFTDHPKLKEMGKILKANPGRSAFCIHSENGYWVKVKAVGRIILERQPTYDLTVNSYPYFVANGLVIHNSGVTLFSQVTTGKPLFIRTSTGNGKTYEAEVMIDITKNKADIISQEEYSKYWRGTEVGGELKGVKFSLRESGPFEYLRRTAIANPHAKITFVDPEGRKTVFERSSEKIPKTPQAIKPHPNGTGVDDLINMAKRTSARRISSFLTGSFSRVSSAKVKEIQDLVDFDLNKNPKRLTWQECEELAKAFEEVKFLAPPREGLITIDEERIRKSVLNILDPEFEVVLTRPPKTHSGGVSFQVEVAIAYGGQAGRVSGEGEGKKVEVMRFANRAPLLFDAGGCAITKAVNSVDWKRYGIKDFENSPVTFFINVVSTYIPYTSAGKQSIADDKAIVKELRIALMEVGRKFQLFHSRKRIALERERKKEILMKYSIELAAAIAVLTDAKKEELLADLNKLIEDKIKIEEALLEKVKKEAEEAVEEPESEFEEGGVEVSEDDSESEEARETLSKGMEKE